MTLKERIQNDLKDSLKSGNKIRLQTIRSIRASLIEFEKSGSGKEIDEAEEIKILTGAAKKRKESIEQYSKAGREDLVRTEEEELKIIMNYLPEQLSSEDIEKEILKLAKNINASSKTDFGKLMSASIKELKGKADGRVIKEIVEKVLSKN
jgi:uncharacterized protein YqeY